ncbi:MAG: hypothetical protein IKT47_04400 [Oscillospiraceae bacterium]|nr:hypothetical protein [Oscillospiraceae bacterium]
MKSKKRIVTMLAIVVAALFVFGLAAAATGGYGSSSDPLITLSYITDIFMPEVDTTINNAIEGKTLEISSKLDDTIVALETKYNEASIASAASTYTVISMSSGEKLVGVKGCEVMLRVGSAYCSAPASPGLIDTSTAGILENGQYLVKNHMYMITIDGRGIVADGDIMIIVRGDYTIE